MREKQKARSSAGTPEQAAEVTGCGTMPISNSDFTPTGGRGQWKITDLLGCGQGAAVPLAHLVSITGAETERFVASMRRRAHEILTTASAVERAACLD